MYPKINDPQNCKAALYLRLSKEDDKNNKADSENSESIENQRALLVKFTEQENLKICGTYIDDGYSGGNYQRPAFKRMIADIESKKINLVITKDMSRLGRDYIDTGFYMERYFPENGVRYISLLDGIDTGSDSYNNDITPFKAILNDMYAKDISKKITAVKRDKQDKGLFIGGKAPYGYLKNPTEKNALIIDETTAEIVRYIFKSALEDKSCREIAIILNAEKIPTPATYAKINLNEKRKGPYSGLWSSELVSFILQNEVYTGKMVQGRMKKINYKSKKCVKVPKEDWIVRDGKHEPIIDRETFEKVGLLIKSRNNTRKRTYDYLLKGLVYCYECSKERKKCTLGVIMRTIKTLSGDYQTLYFICRTYQRFTKHGDTCTAHCVKVETVTNAVLEKVRDICKKYISRLDLEAITEEANSKMLIEQKRQQDSLLNIKANLETIKSKIDRVYNDWLDAKIDEEVYTRTYKRLKDEQSDLQNKLQIHERPDNEKLLDRQKIKELVHKFLEAEEYSKELIVSLIEKVELTKDKELFIHFRFKELDENL